MRQIDIYFASDLVALGSTRLGPASRDWREPCVTGPAQTLSFPRRSFAVVPRNRRASPAVLHAGTVSLARPGAEYERRLVDPAGEQSDWLWLRPDLLDRSVGRWRDAAWRGRTSWCHRLDGPELLRQRRLFDRARHDRARDPAALEALVLEYVDALALGEPATDGRYSASERRRRILEVIEWIASDLERPVRTSELARRAGLSPSHFCVAFRRETGRTLSRYLSDLRLCCALDRLRERGGNLTELALALGFSSHSHFSARFKAAFGCTPSQARARLAEPVEFDPCG